MEHAGVLGLADFVVILIFDLTDGLLCADALLLGKGALVAFLPSYLALEVQ